MNSLQEIALQRLYNQQVIRSNFHQPADLVQWMGALQAQDYPMSGWAIGARIHSLPDQTPLTNSRIDHELEKGTILRTHILRPTWHLVAARDVHWMLQLTAANVKALCKGRHKALEIDDVLLKKSKMILEQAFRDSPRLTRLELHARFKQASIATNDNRLTHLLMDAELDGLLCNTGRIGKQLAYSYLPAIVPAPVVFTREESLGTLARRYFDSHGPATVHDFAWWSGLSMADCRIGIALNHSQLQSFTVNGKTYWCNGVLPSVANAPEMVYLLPAFDESFISYTDRTAFVDKSLLFRVMTNNGIFYPMLIYKGQIVGTWKLQQARTSRIEAVFFSETHHLPELMQTSLQKYSLFLGRELMLTTSVR
jgi:hypothetical protein